MGQQSSKHSTPDNEILLQVVHTLINSSVLSLVKMESLVLFSMMNQQCHQYLFDIICNCTMFEPPPKSHISHYKPKKLTVVSRLDLLHLPPSLTHLQFGDYFNAPLEGTPLSYVYLTFRGRQPVKRIPSSVIHLIFGTKFDQRVDNLPSSITHLIFGLEFNQRVDHLPPNITHLTFGMRFNQPVDHLPPNITHLAFGGHFSHPIDNLPPKITHLTLGGCFARSLERLPQSITYLTLVNLVSRDIDSIRKLFHLSHLTLRSWSAGSLDLPSNIVVLYL